MNWEKIKEKMNEHGYMSGIDRMTDRVKKTAEVFTPTDLVIKILQKMDINSFSPKKTVLDPACGDGQFLFPVKLIKMYHFGMSEEEALQDIYGIDIMQDNVDICRKRLGGGNIYCDDFLNPKTPEVIKLLSKGMEEW